MGGVVLGVAWVVGGVMGVGCCNSYTRMLHGVFVSGLMAWTVLLASSCDRFTSRRTRSAMINDYCSMS